MKLLTSLFILISFISCENQYQESSIGLPPKTEQVRTPSIPEEEVAPRSSFTLNENIQLFLDSFVEKQKGEGQNITAVNYEKLKRQENLIQTRELLDTIKLQFEDLDISSLSKAEIQANYINAYNFAAVILVKSNLYKEGIRIKSIKDLSSSIGSLDILDKKILFFAQKEISLNDIKKKLKELANNDARYNFSLVPASNGISTIYQEAFNGKEINLQLDAVTKNALKLQRVIKIKKNKYRTNNQLKEIEEELSSHVSYNGSKAHSIDSFIKLYREGFNYKYSKRSFKNDWGLNIAKENLYTQNSLSENIQLFYDKYVVFKQEGSEDTLVDYEQLYKDKKDQDTKNLKRAIYDMYAEVDLQSLNKEERLALLINAYNFFAIEMVNSNLYKNGKRLKSITKIGLIPFSAFKKKIFNIGGKIRSLDNIEKGGFPGKESVKELLTHENGTIDARFHFAVICAAKGCPILMKEAYTSKDIYTQLDTATIEGLKQARNLNQTQGKLYLTELFDWYAQDFKNHSTNGEQATGNISNFILDFSPNTNTTLPIGFTKYDWDLNILE